MSRGAIERIDMSVREERAGMLMYVNVAFELFIFVHVLDYVQFSVVCLD